MPKRRVYEIEETEFCRAAADCLSLRDMIRTLDLHDHTNTYRRLRQRITEMNLDISHFRGCGRRLRSYTDDQLKSAVAESRSLRQTLLALGIRAEGGNYRTIRKVIDALDIDTSHFTSNGWRRNETKPVTAPRPLDEILVENSDFSSTQVRKRLLRAGLLRERCQVCGISEWMGKPLTLELDHVNGIHNDHRLENLRMLCPNCHSQTSTFRGRNMSRNESPKPRQLCIL